MPPAGPGVRVDSGVESGSVIAGSFDSLLAKIIVTGADRQQALQRSRRALAEMRVEGMATVLPFHRAVLDDPAFTAADGVVRRAHPVDRDRVRQHHPAFAARPPTPPNPPARGRRSSPRSTAGG